MLYIPAVFHDAVLDVGLDFREHFHKRKVFSESEITNIHFVNSQNIQVGEHLHKVVYVSFIALKELVAYNFRAHELSHFQSVTGIVDVNFKKRFFFAMVSIEVHFVFQLRFENNSLASVVCFLV